MYGQTRPNVIIAFVKMTKLPARIEVNYMQVFQLPFSLLLYIILVILSPLLIHLRVCIMLLDEVKYICIRIKHCQLEIIKMIFLHGNVNVSHGNVDILQQIGDNDNIYSFIGIKLFIIRQLSHHIKTQCWELKIATFDSSSQLLKMVHSPISFVLALLLVLQWGWDLSSLGIRIRNPYIMWRGIQRVGNNIKQLNTLNTPIISCW